MKNKQALIEYWAKSSQMDFEAALELFKSKKYPHCLFFAHLSRYPDEKFNFYKKCTYEFTEKYIRIIKEILSWLKEKL